VAPLAKSLRARPIEKFSVRKARFGRKRIFRLSLDQRIFSGKPPDRCLTQFENLGNAVYEWRDTRRRSLSRRAFIRRHNRNLARRRS
jgi:hypothetical protein